jgi:hypothetical protein
MGTTPKKRKRSKIALFEFYEQINEEMESAYFCSHSESVKERAESNNYNELFDCHLKIDGNSEDPSNDLLRELHTICKSPEISKKIETEILRIVMDELAERKEKARQEALEVYQRLQQPTQTEKVA